MYKLSYTKTFQKDFARCAKRGYDMEIIKTAFSLLEETGTMPQKYRPHKLVNYKNRWECHLKPDWLLVWDHEETTVTLVMIRTGTHSDLFGK